MGRSSEGLTFTPPYNESYVLADGNIEPGSQSFSLIVYASLFGGQASVLHTNTATLFILVLLNSSLGACSGKIET